MVRKPVRSPTNVGRIDDDDLSMYLCVNSWKDFLREHRALNDRTNCEAKLTETSVINCLQDLAWNGNKDTVTYAAYFGVSQEKHQWISPSCTTDFHAFAKTHFVRQTRVWGRLSDYD